MKITNVDASKLLGVYSKMVNASVEDEFFDKAYEVAVDAIAVEDALKPFQKIRDNAQKKLESLDQKSEEFYEVLNKVNKEVENASTKEVELKELSKVSKDFITKNKIKLSGMEIMLLKKYKVLD